MNIQPFEPVLVRDRDDGLWKPDFFGKRMFRAGELEFLCMRGNWKQCIPFKGNEAFLFSHSNPKPKWIPKKGDYIAVRRSGFTDWRILVFVKFENGQILCSAFLNDIDSRGSSVWDEYEHPDNVKSF